MARLDLLLFSLAGVAFLVWLARRLGFDRPPRIAEVGLARTAAADALPGFQPADAVLSADGAAALVADAAGRIALVRPLGDRLVVRLLDQPRVGRSGNVVRVRPQEPMFPETALDLGDAATVWARRL